MSKQQLIKFSNLLKEYNETKQKAQQIRLEKGQGIIRPLRIAMSKFNEFWEEVMSEDDYEPVKIISSYTSNVRGLTNIKLSKENSYLKGMVKGYLAGISKK